jgi:hypothetical protein
MMGGVSWAETDLLHKYAHLTGGRSPDGAFKDCPAPTPEMIEAVKTEALPFYDRDDRIQFHYALRAPAAPQDYLHNNVIAQIKALTGLSPHDYFDYDLQYTLFSDPDFQQFEGMFIFFHDDLYRTFLSRENNFDLSNLMMEDLRGKSFDRFDDAFLEEARKLADQLHQPGWENGFYRVVEQKALLPLRGNNKAVTLIDRLNIDDVSFFLEGGAVKDIAPNFYETSFQKYKDDFWKYVYLRLLYRFVIGHQIQDQKYSTFFASMFSQSVEMRFKALKHMLETDCYTPFDAAFLWVLYSAEGES